MPRLLYQPFEFLSGTCVVSIEVAGPAKPTMMMIVPKALRMLAAVTIQTCVVGSGRGGFSTMGIDALFNYLLHPRTMAYHERIPSDTAFITATVHGIDLKWPSSGDQDPSVPMALSDLFKQQAETLPYDSSGYLTSLMESALYQGDASGQPGLLPWWDRSSSAQNSLLASNKMTYECDSKLGSPSDASCSQIEWSQLGPPSDILTVGPAATTFLHQEDCYLAITATINLALTWQQIRAAVDTLLVFCVNHPYNPSRGGRAFFGTPSYPEINIKKRDDVSGLNALPSCTNITVFQQKEGWSSPEAELSSCTWRAVGDGASVSTCNIV